MLGENGICTEFIDSSIISYCVVTNTELKLITIGKPQPSLSPAASFPSDMEFWGVKVKSGGLLKVTPGEGMVVHVTQASLGKMKKKAKNSARLFVHTDGKKFVLAKLSANNLPQQQLNLVFEKDFELSHNWKKGSVYMFGYKAQNPRADDGKSDLGSEDSDSDEKYPIRETMKPIASSKEFTPGKQKVKIVEQNKDLVPEEDDKDIYVNEDDSKEEGDEHSSGDESDKSDKETLQKVDPTKKRAAESATKMPVQDKRAKVTPHKADGKKGAVHLATPHPMKQAGEPHANKPDQLTPIPRGSISCNSCNRVFINEKALESHSKAKHGWQ